MNERFENSNDSWCLALHLVIVYNNSCYKVFSVLYPKLVLFIGASSLFIKHIAFFVYNEHQLDCEYL